MVIQNSLMIRKAFQASTKKLPAPKRGYVHTIDAGQLARGVQILVHGEDGKKFDPACGVAEL